MRKLYSVLFAFLFTVSSFAGGGGGQQYYYVRPIAYGNNNGTDWANAWSPSTINWTTVKSAINDIGSNVYVCFSGGTTYQEYNLTGPISISQSGTSSGYIVITSGQQSEEPTGHSGYVFLTGKNANGGYNSGVTSIFQLNGNDSIKIFDMTICDIIIPSSAGTKWLIDANNSDYCIFDSLTLKNTFQWYHADPFPSNPDDSEPPIERNVNGINLDAADYTDVLNCKFSYLDCGLYIVKGNNTNSASPTNIEIVNCNFSDNLMDARRYESGSNIYYRYSTLEFENHYSASFHYGEGKDIYFVSANACTVSNCSLSVKGSSGITIDRSSNMTINNNYVSTIINFGSPIANYNLRQVDCIEVGGLGREPSITSDELLTIKENTLINNSTWIKSHDDCIQFYTDIDKIAEGKSSYKRYYYGTNKFQNIEIYKNYIEQTGTSDSTNTGIIIGGAEYYNSNISGFDINYQQGKMTKWRIWSNIIKVNDAKGLISFGNMKPAQIQVFNNTLYAISNTSSSIFIYYNRWPEVSNNNVYLVENMEIKNNIFNSGEESADEVPMLFGTYVANGNYHAPITNFDCSGYDSSPTVFIDYNCYWGGDSTEAIVKRYTLDHTYQSYTLSQWQNSTNPLVNFEENGHSKDPIYVEISPAVVSDFILGMDSPLLDIGTIVNQTTPYYLSFDNDIRPNGEEPDPLVENPNVFWDIGAYEQVFIPNRPKISSNNAGLKYDISAYPNPFNSISNINYTIANDGEVVIKVYDILGNEVKTLVN